MQLAKLKKNAFHNVLGWLLPTIIFLGLTPLMIHKLGVDGFGVISLIQIITGYMNILNFGFSEAITKQIATHAGRDDERVMRTMWAGLSLFAGFGSLGAIGLYLLADYMGHTLLKIPADLQADSVMALKIGSLVFLLQMVAEFFRGTSMGIDRFDVPNICRIIRISLSALFILLSLYLDGGLAGIMLATLMGLIIGLVLNIVWMQKIMPMRATSGPFQPAFTEVFHFSKHIFFTRLAGIVSGKISQFFLGSLSSVGNVAYYEVPARAAEAGSVMLNRILQVFYPGFSAMHGSDNREQARSIFLSVLSIQLLITTPLLLLVTLEGTTLLGVWINTEFAATASIVLILVAITYFFSSFTNLPVFAAMGFGLPGIISKYSIIRMMITAAVVYPLVSRYGLSGAAWTLLLSEASGVLMIHEIGRKVFAASIYRLLARSIIVNALLGCILYLFYTMIFRHSSFYTPFGVLPVVLLYPLLAIAFKAASPEDVRKLKKFIFK